MTGWVPAEEIVHEWDGDRLVRSTVHREPEWDAEQLNMMLAYQEYKNRLGPNGFLLSDELDPGTGFTAEAVTNYATAEVEKLRARYKQDYPEDPQHGVFFVAKKR